jgi:hypothetical protein
MENKDIEINTQNNIRCAEALKWERSDYHNTDNFFLIPKEHGLILGKLRSKSMEMQPQQLNAYPEEMHFHDSRDWSHLLVLKVWDSGKYYSHFMPELLSLMSTDDLLVANPLQICTAALKALETKATEGQSK